MEENKYIVRPDLTDISNTIIHLHELANYFYDNNQYWGVLWHAPEKADTSLDRIYGTRDNEFIESIKDVYTKGRDIAYTFAVELDLVNSVEDYPKIGDFTKRIKCLQDLVKNDENVLKKCEEVTSLKKTYQVNYWAINQMILLHRKQLAVIKGLSLDLKAIENSERYKLENIDKKNVHKKSILAWGNPWFKYFIIPIFVGIVVLMVSLFFSKIHNPEKHINSKINGDSNKVISAPIIGDNNKVNIYEESDSGQKENISDKRIIKVQINRIIKDANGWLNNSLDKENKKGYDLLNELSFNFPDGGYSGKYIENFIQNTKSFQDEVNDYVENSVNRKIEDLMFKEKEYKFSKINWLKEEYAKYSFLLEFARKVKKQAESNNFGYVKRFAKIDEYSKISNEILSKQEESRILK